MRNLFLLLLLANLGVLAVFSWVVKEPALPEPYAGPPITLLRELDRDALIGASDPEPGALVDVREESAESAETAESTEAAAVAAPGEPAPVDAANDTEPAPGRCISIGPFAEAEAAGAAMATLVEAGFEPSRAIREAEVWEGYWVYIERLESVAAARAVEADLADNGIDDTLVISSEDNGILISLGVFSEIARAGNQAESADALGYEATIADSMRRAETHWLDVTLTSEESIALELLQAPGTISRLEQVSCTGARNEP